MCYLFITSNDTTKKSYGVTSPISLVEPTSIDIKLSESLKETLRSHGRGLVTVARPSLAFNQSKCDKGWWTCRAIDNEFSVLCVYRPPLMQNLCSQITYIRHACKGEIIIVWFRTSLYINFYCYSDIYPAIIFQSEFVFFHLGVNIVWLLLIILIDCFSSLFCFSDSSGSWLFDLIGAVQLLHNALLANLTPSSCYVKERVYYYKLNTNNIMYLWLIVHWYIHPHHEILTFFHAKSDVRQSRQPNLRWHFCISWANY